MASAGVAYETRIGEISAELKRLADKEKNGPTVISTQIWSTTANDMFHLVHHRLS
jgi:hypothetical protein